MNLPEDILIIIKNYCFYDFKTFKLINNVKRIKNIIMNQIITARVSRVNSYIDDYDGHWGIWIKENEQPFKGINCIYCGNYCDSGSILYDKIMCTCYY